MSARLTFVVPAYNAGATLADTIQSVLNQTEPCEIVVVDDGSRDGTSEIARSLANPRLKLVRQRNAGLSAARNTGLGEVTTELVSFLDADDTVAPAYAQRMAGAIGSSDIVASAWSFVGPELESLDWTCDVLTQDSDPRRLLEINPYAVGCVVHRTDSLCAQSEGAAVFDASFPGVEDWELLLRRTVKGAAWAPPVPEPLFHYRLRPASMSSDLRLMHDASRRVQDHHAPSILGASPAPARRRRLTLRSLARAVATRDESFTGACLRELSSLCDSDLRVLAGALRIAIGRADALNPTSLSLDQVAPRLAPLALDDETVRWLSAMVCTDAAIARAVPRLIELARGARVVLAGMGRNGRSLAQELAHRGCAERFAWLDDAPGAACPAPWRRIDSDDLGRSDIVVLTPDDPATLGKRITSRRVAMVIPLSRLAQQAPAGDIAQASSP